MKADCPSPQSQDPRIVGVGGFTSKVGKTTLLCELLRAFPGWEAIKVTRGHHCSCAVRSGRDQNYLVGKDTGRFWDAGAANVHWVIATDSQVEQGTRLALERVRSPGVIIEGNSFLRFMDADFFIMVARAEGGRIKPTACRALEKADALFLSGDLSCAAAWERFTAWREKPGFHLPSVHLPVYSHDDLLLLIRHIRERIRT